MLIVFSFRSLCYFDGTNDGLAYLLTKSTNPGLRAAARYHANEKAFRLNKYENCGKILKILML